MRFPQGRQLVGVEDGAGPVETVDDRVETSGDEDCAS